MIKFISLIFIFLFSGLSYSLDAELEALHREADKKIAEEQAKENERVMNWDKKRTDKIDKEYGGTGFMAPSFDHQIYNKRECAALFFVMRGMIGCKNL